VKSLVGWDSAATTGVPVAPAPRRLPRPRRPARAVRRAPGTRTRPRPLRLPLIGAIDPATLSLPALTLVLASLDAFNPCAFFVLLFLLSMMAHQKSRARMLLIGSIFVTVSGLMYFAFMAAWLSVFQVFGHLAWVTLAAGALALFVGIVNAKDFFAFERGPTLSIPESRKPDIFRRTRAILAADRLPAMVVATTVLAVAANFYELLCTAGFPMVYTRLLTLAEPSPPRAIRLSRRLQPGLCATVGGDRRRLRRHARRAQAQRTRRPAAQAAVRRHDARTRRPAVAGPGSPQPCRHRYRADGQRRAGHLGCRPADARTMTTRESAPATRRIDLENT
jgi:hypothetical protein